MGEAPTSYKVSTITSTACVCSKLDIAALFKDVALAAPYEEAGIIRGEFIDENKQPVSRGEDVRKANRRRNSKKKKRFENQATFLIRPTAQAANVVNTKVFRNGNVQMTGNRSYEDGVRCVELLIEGIRGVRDAAETPLDMRCDNYLIRLINSDFRVPFRINNPALQRAMMTSDYVSIYEPCIYPGVKILYYHNDKSSGRCPCQPHCNGKSCKKITIAVFQSGAVIITGAVDMVMLDAAYGFTSGTLMDMRERIEQKSMSALVSKMAALLGKPRDQSILNFCTPRAKDS